MPTTEDSVEEIYRARMAELAPKDRVARMVAMAQWAREQISRQLQAAHPSDSATRLRWRLALELYGKDPELRTIIERKLDHVSS